LVFAAGIVVVSITLLSWCLLPRFLCAGVVVRLVVVAGLALGAVGLLRGILLVARPPFSTRLLFCTGLVRILRLTGILFPGGALAVVLRLLWIVRLRRAAGLTAVGFGGFVLIVGLSRAAGVVVLSILLL